MKIFFKCLAVSLLLLNNPILSLRNCWDPRTWNNDTMQTHSTFTFTPVSAKHFSLLFRWFKEPHIAPLWVEPTDWQEFTQKWTAHLNSSDAFRFIAAIDNEPVGYIQYYRVNDTDRAHFPGIVIPEHAIGMDLFIGEPALLNKGYGTQLIKEFITFAKEREPQCTSIIIDPAPDNHRAIACYKKVGFKEIGEFVVPYGPIGNGPGPVFVSLTKGVTKEVSTTPGTACLLMMHSIIQ